MMEVNKLADELCRRYEGYKARVLVPEDRIHWTRLAEYVRELIDTESHERRERAKDAETACVGLKAEVERLKARPAEVLRGSLLAPMTEAEGAVWPSDAIRHFNLIAEARRSQAPRVTVEELVMTTPMPVAVEIRHREEIVATILERLDGKVVMAPVTGSPGDSMTDEELATELLAQTHLGRLHPQMMAARARELFRPGSKAPDRPADQPDLAEVQGRLDACRSELAATRAVPNRDAAAAYQLARHVQDMLAALRVSEDWNEIEELAREWAGGPAELDADPADR